MRPQQTSITGVGSSPWLVFDYAASGAVAVQVDVTGTITWTLESTLSDPLKVNPIPAAQIYPTNDTNMVSQTVGRQGNFAFAPRACRVTTSAGSGTATLRVIQYEAGGV